MISRRRLVQTASALGALLPWLNARADEAGYLAALERFTGGARAKPGRITIDLPALAENGNSVGMTLVLEQNNRAQPQRVIVLAPRNPEPVIAEFQFGPLALTDALETRIRLANSQTITAVAAYSDGGYWQASADIVVTQAACVEGLI